MLLINSSVMGYSNFTLHHPPTSLPYIRIPSSIEWSIIVVILVLGFLSICAYFFSAEFSIHFRCCHGYKDGVVLYLDFHEQKVYSRNDIDKKYFLCFWYYPRSKYRMLSLPKSKYVAFNKDTTSNDDTMIDIGQHTPAELQDVAGATYNTDDVTGATYNVDDVASDDCDSVGSDSRPLIHLSTVDVSFKNDISHHDVVKMDTDNETSIFNDECAICLMEFEPNEVLLMLDCRHGYHDYCIGRHVTESSTCPLCMQKQVVRQHDRDLPPPTALLPSHRASSLFSGMSYDYS